MHKCRGKTCVVLDGAAHNSCALSGSSFGELSCVGWSEGTVYLGVRHMYVHELVKVISDSGEHYIFMQMMYML